MKKDNPLISVIVPIYNVENYLEQCINSIINQTYKNLEIILINDGSTDTSGLICDNYLKIDKRIKVFHQENGGLSKARNEGINHANGEFIGLVDSDDFLMPRMYEILLEMCLQNDCLIAKCETIDIKEREVPSINLKNNIKIYNSDEILNKLYQRDNIYNPAPCNKLYSKEIFNKVLFPEGIIHEDEAVMCQFIYYAKKIAITDAILYCYFLSPNSIMRSKFKEKHLDALAAFEIRLDFLQKINMKELYLKSLVIYSEKIALLYYKVVYSDISDKDRLFRVLNKKRTKIKEELLHNKYYSIMSKVKEYILYKFPPIFKIIENLKNFIRPYYRLVKSKSI